MFKLEYFLKGVIKLSKRKKTPYEEKIEEVTKQTRVLQARLSRTQKRSPEYEALLQNLAAVSILKAELEVLLETAKEKTPAKV